VIPANSVSRITNLLKARWMAYFVREYELKLIYSGILVAECQPVTQTVPLLEIAKQIWQNQSKSELTCR